LKNSSTKWSKKFTLITTVGATRENRRLLGALKPTWQGITGEPECLFFDLWHDPDHPVTFKMIEV
jgi:hypothetical protein